MNGEIIPYLEASKPKTAREVVLERKIFDIKFEEHEKIGHKGIGFRLNLIASNGYVIFKRYLAMSLVIYGP